MNISSLRPNPSTLPMLFILGIAMLGAGCGVVASSSATPLPNASSTASTPPDGILSGQVVARSSCPAQNSVTPCALAPVAGRTVTVETVSGDTIATLTTDTQGRFRLSLPQGHYMVRPASGNSPAATPSSAVEVDVAAGQTISIQLVVSAGPPRS
jgi:hypothetical protein